MLCTRHILHGYDLVFNKMDDMYCDAIHNALCIDESVVFYFTGGVSKKTHTRQEMICHRSCK